MAQNTTKSVPAKTWTQLTNADVTSLTFQVIEKPVYIKGTASASAPSSTSGALLYRTGQGEVNVDLSNLFPGISAARVWAYALQDVEVVVSHA